MSGAPTPEPTTPRGLEADAGDPERLRHLIDVAFDYRGDVTVTSRSGTTHVGYLFDRGDRENGRVRLMLADGGRIEIPIDDVQTLAITGRDTAEGKSFDTWVKKYLRQKLAGQAADIERDLDA